MLPIETVLDLGRWSPSGDNTQPWRFRIEGSDRVVILGHDTRDHCVYDLDGHPSHISLGALLETIALAATRYGWRTDVLPVRGASETNPTFRVTFRPDGSVAESPLTAWITERRVQRRPLALRGLRVSERQALEAAVAPNYEVRWFDGWRGRGQVAWLNFRSAKIRMVTPEAYAVHRAIIDWGREFSDDRVPSAALGASAPTLRLMRWAMQSWGRITMMNRWLGGTLMPRVELDLVPGLACAAHWVLQAQHAPRGVDDYVCAGRAVQRFWLTATSLGLQCQPGYTPLIFARYATDGRRFTTVASALERANEVRARLVGLLGAGDASRAVFMGRIGAGPTASARSTRRPLQDLLVASTQEGDRDRTQSA